MSEQGPRPPRRAEALLWRLLERSSPSAEYIVGDLREEYAARRRRSSPPTAFVWYVVTAARIAVRLRWEESRGEGSIAGRSHPVRPAPGDLMRNELRQAVRFLLRRPGFSTAIVLTVALAIAATTVAYAVVDGVLLEPLPYDEPERLVAVWEHNIPRERRDNVVSPANFLTWQDRARSFERLASIVAFSANVTGDEAPERVGAVQASATIFPMIGATPLIGRLYGDSDDQVGAPGVAVLTESYWRRRYGGAHDVIGRTIVLGGDITTIVGVLPDRFDVPVAAEFNGTGTHDIWVPPAFSEETRTWSGRYLQVIGQLRRGTSVEQARAEMSALAAALREEFPDRQTGWDVTVLPFIDEVVGDVRTTLLVMFGAVCFVLLIACGNVANLLLTRAVARQQEMAVRSALGAGQGRLLRQLLTESVLLSGAGGIVGLLLAYWLIRSLIAAAPDIPRIDALGMDASVVGFSIAAVLATALLFGLAPALHVLGGDVADWLRDRGAGQSRRGGNRLRSTLVVAQVALSLVLLVGAGLLIRSFANRLALGVGFDVEHMLAADIQPPNETYDSTAQARFFEELVERVRTLPGVRAASAITFAPLSGLGSATTIWRMDRPVPPPGERLTADIRWVHRDYLAVTGAPLIAGRFFDETDREGTPLRLVVNESAAREIWPGEDPLGKQLAMPWGDTLEAEVIGVIGDILYDGPDSERRPMLYWEHRQFRAFEQMTVLVRSTGDPYTIASGLRAAVRELDPDLPVYNVTSMEELYDDALARPRFATLALSLFAVLGLLLAGIGIYGVIAYVTQQRSREIGIRLALGARRGEVQRMVLRQGALLIVLALVVGSAGALAVTRLLQGLVFDVSTTDPVTFGAMAALLSAIALLACWIPARRASTIDPVEAIRYEG